MSLTNLMRREAERAMSRKAATCMGIVSGYDPSTYSAKVVLQPEGQETGFIPIATPWAGDGWGMAAGPSVGDMVDVHFQEWGKGGAYVSLRFQGDKSRPMGVPSGEFWLKHASGSFVKFLNDGSLAISAATAINSTAPVWNHAGNVVVTGFIKATEDITDFYETTGSSMAHFRQLYDDHKHEAPDGITSPPLAPDEL